MQNVVYEAVCTIKMQFDIETGYRTISRTTYKQLHSSCSQAKADISAAENVFLSITNNENSSVDKYKYAHNICIINHSVIEIHRKNNRSCETQSTSIDFFQWER